MRLRDHHTLLRTTANRRRTLGLPHEAIVEDGPILRALTQLQDDRAAALVAGAIIAKGVFRQRRCCRSARHRAAYTLDRPGRALPGHREPIAQLILIGRRVDQEIFAVA